MMLDSALALRALFPLVKAIWPRIKQLRLERQAGEAPLQGRFDLVDSILDDIFKHICRPSLDDAWWRRLLNHASVAYVAPEVLTHPDIQRWLSNEQVRTDLKALTRARISGREDHHTEARERLTKAYIGETGKTGLLAARPIVTVVAILTAGYFARIPDNLQALAGLGELYAQENRENFRKLHALIDKGDIPPSIKSIITDKAKFELSNILKRRFDKTQTRTEILQLAQLADTGEFKFANHSIRTQIFYWASRFHAQDNQTISTAKKYLALLQALDDTVDIRIIEALILANEGDTDNAIHLLRDIDEADARSNLLYILTQYHGATAALEWFDTQTEKYRKDLLTGIGWSNLAIRLAEAERWDDAISYLAFSRELVIDCPYLAYIEGVVNAAMLLPGQRRHLALEMNFDEHIRTIEGTEADERRRHADTCFSQASLYLEEIHPPTAKVAETWRLWLKLTNPKTEIANFARQEIADGMKDGRKAVELVRFALAFDIPFDHIPLRTYLTQRNRLGGLDENELAAEILLTVKTLPPRERFNYLVREEHRIINPAINSN